MNFIRAWFNVLLHVLVSVLREPWDFILLLLKRLRALCQLKMSRKRLPCLPLPPDVARKPDPLIYCQSYLQSLGIAVTWDNPDIHLFKGGVPVNPHDLQPNTNYDVAITIHNGSNEAPAPNTQVTLYYRKWGVAGPWILASQGNVDVPVRGAAGEPAGITLPWKTPNDSGHFCLLAVLYQANDLNPANNFGQTNTDISPNAKRGEVLRFDIPVMHMLPGRRNLKLQLTSYRLPDKPLYPPAPEGALDRYESQLRGKDKQLSLKDLINAADVTGPMPVTNWSAFRLLTPVRPGKPIAIKQFGQDWLPNIVKANSPQAHPAPAEWRPTLAVDTIELEPNVETTVQLTVQVPADAKPGQLMPFQVNAFDDLTGLVGGVEVVVQVG
jgi:hypothetical protein